MSAGTRVRAILPNRIEEVLSDAYRRMFVDLDSVAETIAALGRYGTVIEVGCGDGALLSRLLDRLGTSVVATGIDIAPDPGRRYRGTTHDVTFRQARVQDMVAEGRKYELVVISDVIHHVPVEQRGEFLDCCRSLMAPAGTIVVKEWVRRRNVAHLAAFISDRYISGDRAVSFWSERELRAVFRTSFHDGESAPFLTSFTRPHWNNVLCASTRSGSNRSVDHGAVRAVGGEGSARALDDHGAVPTNTVSL